VTAPTFTEVNYGYAQPAAEVITIVSSGNSNATISTVGLSGTDASSFTLNKTDGATITAGSTDNNTYTVRPNSGLAVGTYTATITVTYDGGATATADVSFTVSTAGTVATPTFSPAAGTYIGSQSVTISCSTDGATIHYTTNGDTPTAGSPTYTGAIAVDATKTIKAIAVKDGMTNSGVATAEYTISAPTYTLSVTAPTFAEEIYGYSQPAAAAITITSTGNSDATISSVALSGTNTDSFTLNTTAGTTITAGGADSTTYTIQPNSGLAVGTYTATITVTYNGGATTTTDVTFVVNTAGTVATPTFSPATGAEFADSQQITINCATAGAEIHYTTDGSTPTASSATYSAPFTINATKTVKAIAVKAGMIDSAVATATYTKLEPHSIGVTSPENGAVAKSSETAASGASITLTVTPAYGYHLEALTVSGISGDVAFTPSVDKTTTSATTYTFAMPNEEVTVQAEFAVTIVTAINTYSEVARDGGNEITDITFKAANYDTVRTWYTNNAGAGSDFANFLEAHRGITLVTASSLPTQFLLIDKYGKAETPHEDEPTPLDKWNHMVNGHGGGDAATAFANYYGLRCFAFSWDNDSSTQVKMYSYNATTKEMGELKGTVISSPSTWNGNTFTSSTDGEGIANDSSSNGDYAIVIGGYWYVFHWDSQGGITEVNP
jgi:methionine-rich copper-binding protein CopC